MGSTPTQSTREELTSQDHYNMYYIGKIVGEFTETQKVEADSLEQAIEKLKENAGETIERTVTGDLEVSDVVEVE